MLKGEELDLKWEPPKTQELVDFLCKDKGFSEERVRKGAEKLSKALGQKQQGRLDGFFSVQGSAPKRKAEEQDTKGSKKGKAAAGKGKGKK